MIGERNYIRRPIPKPAFRLEVREAVPGTIYGYETHTFKRTFFRGMLES